MYIVFLISRGELKFPLRMKGFVQIHTQLDLRIFFLDKRWWASGNDSNRSSEGDGTSSQHTSKTYTCGWWVSSHGLERSYGLALLLTSHNNATQKYLVFTGEQAGSLKATLAGGG